MVHGLALACQSRMHGKRHGARSSRAGLLLAAALTLCACKRDASPPPPLAFPSAPSGRLEITYPLDNTLFPPEVVAPTFVWSDETEGVARWTVLVRFDAAGEVLRFPAAETRWRPSESEWAEIKAIHGARRRGGGRRRGAGCKGRLRRKRSHPHLDGRGGTESSTAKFRCPSSRPFRTLRASAGALARSTPKTGRQSSWRTCRSAATATRFRRDGSVLGLDVDYGNDKGGYAILPVSQQMVLNDEKIITWSDYKHDDGELTFGLLSQVSPDGRSW